MILYKSYGIQQRKYLIPDTLIDPTTNQEIKTGSNEKSVLTLNVAEKNLKQGAVARWRHCMEYAQSEARARARLASAYPLLADGAGPRD